MKRRNVLGGALAGPLVPNPLSKCAYVQRNSSIITCSSESPAFKTGEVVVAGNKIFYRRYGKGPPITVFHNPFGQVHLAKTCLKNTFLLTAIRCGPMESAKSNEPRQRSVSSTIASTRKPRSESNAPCCILWAEGGPFDMFYTKEGVRWVFGVTGLHTRKDRP